MAQLHETLAVEKDLKNVSAKLIAESMRTLNKENLFSGGTKILEMFDDNLANLNTSEVQVIETTVDENLDFTLPHVAKFWDLTLQKDAANQNAKSDIVVAGVTIASDVPSTFLLGLEEKLGSLRALYEKIPTLAPGIKWIADESNAKNGVFITADDAVTFKTENVIDYEVIVEATEHHRAEIRESKKVKSIGKYSSSRTSGMFTPVEKARRIENLDTLLRAVRKARQRANKQSINKELQIGKQLLDFINK